MRRSNSMSFFNRLIKSKVSTVCIFNIKCNSQQKKRNIIKSKDFNYFNQTEIKTGYFYDL